LAGETVSTWDAVVDVSNVCWSPYLPPEDRHRPHWARLELVLAAWRELHGDGARFRLVADDSLWRAFDRADLREFRRLINSGGLVTRQVADPLVLELARDHDLHVITRDHYIDYRLAHPWIDYAADRFHCWAVGDDGRVRIEPLGIVPHSAQTVSVAIEVKDLKRVTRLDSKNPRHRKILGTRWRCANVRCAEASQWQGQILTWPAVTGDGEALCPACASVLENLGPRDPLYEVVVEDRESGNEITRFPLEEGTSLLVGRGAGLKGIDLGARHTPYRDAVMHVSRRHLLLRIEQVNTSRRIVAVDLGSRNGTTVERWEQKAFLPPKAVAPEKDLYLGSKDRLVLGDAVNLRLSGKHYVRASGTVEGDAGEPAQVEVPYWAADADPGSTVVIDAIMSGGNAGAGTPPDGGIPAPLAAAWPASSPA
jgi:hypothetical protein